MKAVVKGAGYILVHVPDMVLRNGTTQTTEKIVNPESEYLKELPKHLRTFEEVCSYWPNQVYIGNKTPYELAALQPDPKRGWVDIKCDVNSASGRFGQIMPQHQFLLLMQICDVFDLVKLDGDFVAKRKDEFAANELISEDIVARIPAAQTEKSEIERLVNEEHAEGLYIDNLLVGCVKRAHDIDANLSAHVMHENIVSKASSVLALLAGIKSTGINKEDVEYVIDCCEEACGDMNQRGGGNFAKAAAEIAGLVNASGSDTRGFCAGPAHAMIEAASLIAGGVYKTVMVAAGGCTAKLGMNAKNHVEKDLPALEDCLGGFSVVLTKDNGTDPVINLNMVGRHTVGTGSAPQNVIGSLVAEPLQKNGLTIPDIDRFSPEMQNPDITKPAGAGDVPLANYKMIAALAVKNGQLEKAKLAEFTKTHGLTGWAPTQGHIPSGVPYIGFAREELLEGKISRAMIIGKGSLFLGRMTNLFDGVSFVMERNSGEEEQSSEAVRRPKIALTGIGSELGEENVFKAALAAAKKNIDVYYIGSMKSDLLHCIDAKDDEDCHKIMDQLLSDKKVDAAVTMHYPFPVGVSTVGRAVTPAMGKEVFIANTTGISATDRVEAMVRNAVAGIIAAKSCGIEKPTLGILNVDGARQCEQALDKLKAAGLDFEWAQSARSDGGAVLRGNDVIQGSCDIIVTDSLTGNVIMKMLSSFVSGGNYETTGFGYGPGIGQDYNKLVLIVSRASGAPVITGALEYAAQLVNAGIMGIAAEEYKAAEKAGLSALFGKAAKGSDSEVSCPAKEPVTASILGIDVMDLEDAVQLLWKAGIYAESGMGCTGPLVMMSDANYDKAVELLKEAEYIK